MNIDKKTNEIMDLFLDRPGDTRVAIGEKLIEIINQVKQNAADAIKLVPPYTFYQKDKLIDIDLAVKVIINS